jgi:hypothetical protein
MYLDKADNGGAKPRHYIFAEESARFDMNGFLAKVTEFKHLGGAGS